MLDSTRKMVYNIFNCDGQNSGFFILALAKTSYLCYHSIWPRLNRTASAVASIRKTVDRGHSFLNTFFNAETATIRLVGRVTVSKGLSIMRAAMRDSLPYYLKICQHNIPNLSQLNPSESPGGGHPDQPVAAGDSPGATGLCDLLAIRAGASTPLYPRSYLFPLPFVRLPVPCADKATGTGGLSGGAA